MDFFYHCIIHAVNELHLSCEAGSGGNVVMQGCLTLGTAPFDTLNGTYQTLEFYFVRNCEGTHAYTYLCSYTYKLLFYH